MSIHTVTTDFKKVANNSVYGKCHIKYFSQICVKEANLWIF